MVDFLERIRDTIRDADPNSRFTLCVAPPHTDATLRYLQQELTSVQWARIDLVARQTEPPRA